MKDFKVKNRYQASQQGFSLMEVLIAIAIFAIGMLALASFQGALTRSSAEAKVRTTAVNIAEQIIEGQKGFALLSGGAFSFAGIADVLIGSPIIFDSEMTRNPATPVGMIYTVTQDVTDYYYDLVDDVDSTKDAFNDECPTPPPCTTIPDFKTVTVKVDWVGNSIPDFVIDENTQAGNLGGGSIQVTATISNVSVAAALKVTEETDDDIVAPVIVYTPGLNPDIVSLALGDNKFKESLTPEPKVFRENLETRFDVVTYSQASGAADGFFLRREEFVAVSCECALAASGQAKPPSIWVGDEYTEPPFVNKAMGVVDGNVAQSSLCDICCRDHHDAAGSALYDPSRPTTEYSGTNHKHYAKDHSPVSTAGDSYLEACKLVRKDGFFRVAQDFRLEGLNTFPKDFLINISQVDAYSEYVTEEVYALGDRFSYVAAAIDIGVFNGFDGTPYQLSTTPPAPVVDTAPRTASEEPPTGVVAAGDLTLGYTFLPTPTGDNSQQLRSRTIYIDNISSDLLWVLNCIEDPSKVTHEEKLECKRGDVDLDLLSEANILEIIPFFEIQTTFLNDWEKDTANLFFTLSNEPIETGNTHSRGVVEEDDGGGADIVKTVVNRGVTGLTATDPINRFAGYELPDPAAGNIEVITGAGEPPIPGEIITGTIISLVPGLKASNVLVTASNATCSYITASGEFTCFIPEGGGPGPTMNISEYEKPPKTIVLCSSHQTTGLSLSLGSGGNSTNADLSDAEEVTPYVISIYQNACP